MSKLKEKCDCGHFFEEKRMIFLITAKYTYSDLQVNLNFSANGKSIISKLKPVPCSRKRIKLFYQNKMFI